MDDWAGRRRGCVSRCQTPTVCDVTGAAVTEPCMRGSEESAARSALHGEESTALCTLVWSGEMRPSMFGVGNLLGEILLCCPNSTLDGATVAPVEQHYSTAHAVTPFRVVDCTVLYFACDTLCRSGTLWRSGSGTVLSGH